MMFGAQADALDVLHVTCLSNKDAETEVVHQLNWNYWRNYLGIGSRNSPYSPNPAIGMGFAHWLSR